MSLDVLIGISVVACISVTLNIILLYLYWKRERRKDHRYRQPRFRTSNHMFVFHSDSDILGTDSSNEMSVLRESSPAITGMQNTKFIEMNGIMKSWHDVFCVKNSEWWENVIKKTIGWMMSILVLYQLYLQPIYFEYITYYMWTEFVTWKLECVENWTGFKLKNNNDRISFTSTLWSSSLHSFMLCVYLSPKSATWW